MRRLLAGSGGAAVLALLGYLAFLGYFGGPLFETVPATAAPPAAERGTVAVFVSGDMGFNAGMAPRIARRIAAQGIPVIGVNALTAFARGGNAATATTLVREAVARAAALPGTRRVFLIGQSFGANIVLAGAGALPPALKARVGLVGLVVPGDRMAFRATPGGVPDIGSDGLALPVAVRLDDMPVLCIHGEAEADSLCPLWHRRNVRAAVLPGDHYLHHDDALVTAVLLRAFAATLG